MIMIMSFVLFNHILTNDSSYPRLKALLAVRCLLFKKKIEKLKKENKVVHNSNEVVVVLSMESDLFRNYLFMS